MSIEIVSDGQRHVIVDSQTDTAFAPVFWGDEKPEDFLEWLSDPITTYQQHHLVYLANCWRNGQEYAA